VAYNFRLYLGSGSITINQGDDREEIINGAAVQILRIEKPKAFDLYYFVELNRQRYEQLSQLTKDIRPNKVTIVRGDCNQELCKIADFLKNRPGWRSVIFIDPFGMQLKYETIQHLKGVNTDFVILVPTGGANRLLRTDGNIDDSWFAKLEVFLGMKKEDIVQHFYTSKPSLFEDMPIVEKDVKAINLLGELYRSRLKEIFSQVTSPYIIRNSNNAIMFHFFFASNHPIARNIGEHIVKKYSHGYNKH